MRTDHESPGTGLPADLDLEALDRKYREEREKRLRPDGDSQYIKLEGEFADFASDPYADPDFTRDSITADFEVVVVGGGLAGLLSAARMREVGVESVCVIEKGADFGGVWYWNRYPGVRCDIESYIYMPLLEETGFMPTEKYASGAEIFEHCQRIGRQFDLYKDACLQTQVTSIAWDEELRRWVIRTDRDDEIRAQFVCLGQGSMAIPKLPGIPGIKNFKGQMFHSSRWNYELTGGDADGNCQRLADKRVAVIGTGATAVQIVPRLAESVGELFVLQRTPSAIGVRANEPTDADWFADLEPGWQRRRMRNFTQWQFYTTDENWVGDGFTELASKVREVQAENPGLSDSEVHTLANVAQMEQIRARVNDIVSDPETRRGLVPWYAYWCKRPCFSDEYLQAFNQPNVHLVNTDGRGAESITDRGVQVNGTTYDVDVLVFATGFEAQPVMYDIGGYELAGREGLDIADKWRSGVSTLYGIHTHGFPNLFIIGNLWQSATPGGNVTYLLDEQARHAAGCVKKCRDAGVEVMEVRAEAEHAWGAAIEKYRGSSNEYGGGKGDFFAECTPSYLNHEGDTSKINRSDTFYGAGPDPYFDMLVTSTNEEFDSLFETLVDERQHEASRVLTRSTRPQHG